MNKPNNTNKLGFPVEKLVAAKGRGIIQSVAKTTLIDNDSTIVTDRVGHVFVTPSSDSFIVIARPEIEYKEKQTVVIMSKFVLKSLRETHNSPQVNLSQPRVPANSPRYSEELARKWNR